MIILNSEHFEEAATLVCNLWGLPYCDDTVEAISTVILHAPPDMGEFKEEYIGNRVAKMMANKQAFDKLQEIKAKRDVQLKQQAETKPVGDSASGSVQDNKIQTT